MAQNVALLTRGGSQNVALLTRSVAATTPAIITAALPDGRYGLPYSQQIQATGTGPLSFMLLDGELPAGLEIDAQGMVSGSPTDPVSASFTVFVSGPGGSDSKALTIIVPNEGSAVEAPAVTTVIIVPATAEVPQGETVDLFTTVEDQNSDPIPNISGTVASSATSTATAAMPDPTDVTGQTAITVTPGINAGTANITATFDGIASNAAAVTVTMAAVAPTITTHNLPSGTVGTAYSAQLASTGTPPLSYAVTAGALPAGLSLSTGGLLSGTPTTAGTSNFTATVTNLAGFDDQAFVFTVAAAGAVTGVSVSPDTTSIATNGQAQFTATVLGTGGFSSAVSWSVVSGGGTISASGLYSAPATATTATIRATSVQDPAQFSDATVTVQVPGVDTLHIPGIRIAAWVGTQRTLRVRLTTSGGSEGLTVTATSSDPSNVTVTPSALTNAGGIATFTIDFVSGGTAVLSFAGEGMTGEILAVSRTQE